MFELDVRGEYGRLFRIGVFFLFSPTGRLNFHTRQRSIELDRARRKIEAQMRITSPAAYKQVFVQRLVQLRLQPALQPAAKPDSSASATLQDAAGIAPVFAASSEVGVVKNKCWPRVLSSC